MPTSHHEDEQKMSLLYEASYTGNVTTLKSLIEKDQLFLYKISQSNFTETPLHRSALLGHLDFTKTLLSLKPQLARELDSSQSTALHLASAEGHTDIVKELLQVHDEACLFFDEQGRIPLHYAAMRGRIEVVKELIRAKPESLRILDKGQTVLHLCVTYNQLETLKTLVELEVDTSELLNYRDFDGNTILHLAIMLKQVKTIRYLLSIPQIREAASLEKEMEFTAHDILENSSKDWKSVEIQIMLMNAGIKSSEKRGIDTQSPTSIPPKKGWRKILESMGNLLRHKGDWLEEMRGTLSVVATVISTITFQAVMNPPGGFIQQNIESKKEPLACFNDSVYGELCPGEAVLASKYPYEFHIYLVCSTISFIISLSVTLLLVSGLPLKHKAVMWALSIGMCTTVTALALAYLYGVIMLTPGNLFGSAKKMVKISRWIWIVLLGLVGVYLTVHFVIWLVNKRIEKLKREKSMRLKERTDL